MTGHGGDGFLKFQDSEEVTNIELADALCGFTRTVKTLDNRCS